MAHHSFRQGDSAGTISIVIASGLGATIADAACSFAARNQNRENVVVNVSGTIGSVVTAGDGSKGATFSVALPAELAEEAGFYWGQFKVTYPDGTVQIVPGAELLTVEIAPNYETFDEEDDAVDIASYLQTQAAHGFEVLDLIRFDAGMWSKARANDPDTLAQAIVIAVPSTTTFRLLYLANREVTFAAHSFTGVLYLSQSTAGALTSSAPSTGIRQLVAIVKDANTLILVNVSPEFV